MKTLVYGYGNPARQDDGLGPAFITRVEARDCAGIDVDQDFQLCLEDALTVAEYDRVIFVDATCEGDDPFRLYEIEPQAAVEVDSHSLEPEAVLGLAHELFHAATKGYMLAIRGYSFEMFVEELSRQAQENLDKAMEYFFANMHTSDHSTKSHIRSDYA